MQYWLLKPKLVIQREFKHDKIKNSYVDVFNPFDYKRRNTDIVFNIGKNRYSNLENDLNESFKLIGSKSRILPINDNLCIILLFILDKLNLSPLSSWHYLSYSWNFHYDLEETFKKLSWRPKYSNIEIICEAYKSYYDNINNLGNNESTHRSKVNQKFLRLLKVFL